MKTMKRLGAILLAVLMIASVSVTATAAEFKYAAITGSTTSFDKVLIMDANAFVPNVTFAYSITAGTGIAFNATGNKIEVYQGSTAANENGPVSGAPTIGSAAFTTADTGSLSATHDWATIPEGKKAVSKTVTIDFTGVTFREPGIYRWIVTETSEDQQGITYDTQVGTGDNITAKQRVLDVYVIDSNSTLTVDSYVLHKAADEVLLGDEYGSAFASTAVDANNRLTDKSQGFVNEYATYDLSLTKQVSGNQASKDKYFKFTINITNAGANSYLNVVWSDDAAKTPTQTSATAAAYTATVMSEANGLDENSSANGLQWLTDASGNVSKTLYLQHGQTVYIKGLAAGAGYSITEEAEDYSSACTTNNASLAKKDDSHDGLTSNQAISFTNTRNGIVPTGVMLTVVPGLVLVALAIVGLVLFSRKKKDRA